MHEQTVTENIAVSVESSYVPEQSDPANGRYFFSYRIRIENQGTRTVRLISRHWIITDGYGRVEDVRGAGVVGQQPTLEPGASFEYESFCPLGTPTGMMRGTYQMADADGSTFSVVIPQFFLIEPGSFH